MSNFSGGGQQPPGFYRDNRGTMRWWDGSRFTEHTQNSAAPPTRTPFIPPPPARTTLIGRLFGRGRWYYALPVLSLGLLAWVPFLHASSRTHDGRVRRGQVAFYGSLAVGVLVLAGLTPTDAQGESVGAAGAVLSTATGVSAIAIIIAACIQLRPLRSAVYDRTVQPDLAPPFGERAVAQALAARERRQKARELAERDPNLARDLRIGRPDQVRDYDDGGLVDLNSAPAELLVSLCDLTPEVAERVVTTRQQWGSGFSSIEEVLAYVDVSERDASVLRDRGIVLPS